MLSGILSKGGAMQTTVALVHPYWDFWESSVGADLRADRQRLLDRTADALRPSHGVQTALVSSPVEGAAAAARFRDVDAVVVLSTMAVPPTTTTALLELLPGLPVVVWGLHAEPGLPLEVTHSDITHRGATVGAPMVTSALARLGRPFDVVLTTLASPQPALSAVGRAVAAGIVRRATLLQVGDTIPGYISVAADDDALKDVGARVVRVDAAEVAERSYEVDARAVAERVRQVDKEFDVSADVDPAALRRVLQIEVALEQLAHEHGAAAGAMNCHHPLLRHDRQVGVAPCLALGRLTTSGTPWTCTGDVVTALAMLAVRALGHPTLYHEIEVVDDDRGEVVLANTGEHDLGLCGDGRAALQPNVWFTGDPLVGPCAQFTLPAGPASLVAFVLAPQPRWITAEGTFTGRAAPLTGTAHAGFRFASGPARQVWPAWAAAGASHHSVATNAHVAEDIRAIAQHLSAAHVTV